MEYLLIVKNVILQIVIEEISRHAIDGKELHDVFVKMYGRTPDNWIKKYNAALEEESTDESMLGFLTSPKPTKPGSPRFMP